jgi:hypothetical protein
MDMFNGNFSWRTFFLGFVTRKFVLAATLQVIATYFAYDAMASLDSAISESGKLAAQVGPQIVDIFWKWCLFTMANGATFGLFNSVSKYAGVSMEKAKVLQKGPGGLVDTAVGLGKTVFGKQSADTVKKDEPRPPMAGRP